MTAAAATPAGSPGRAASIRRPTPTTRTTCARSRSASRSEWDHVREALAGSASFLHIDVPSTGVEKELEDFPTIGLARYGSTGQAQLLANYGACTRDRLEWALDPQTSCGGGCADPRSGPPIAWSPQGPGTPDPCCGLNACASEPTGGSTGEGSTTSGWTPESSGGDTHASSGDPVPPAPDPASTSSADDTGVDAPQESASAGSSASDAQSTGEGEEPDAVSTTDGCGCASGDPPVSAPLLLIGLLGLRRRTRTSTVGRRRR
ncbi:MAG: MYXO-CTERM sorting domain-containing protein [Nannocystaceae bacterium]